MSRLERWSRIKRGLEPDDPSPDATREVPAQQDAQPSPTAEESPSAARPFEDMPESDGRDDADDTAAQAKAPPPPGSLDDTLPDPDTLDAGSDFSGYMVPGVSAALRRRALKRLWSTGNYNVRDGLDDYDLDYTQQLKPMATDLAGKLRRWVKKPMKAWIQIVKTRRLTNRPRQRPLITKPRRQRLAMTSQRTSRHRH